MSREETIQDVILVLRLKPGARLFQALLKFLQSHELLDPKEQEGG